MYLETFGLFIQVSLSLRVSILIHLTFKRLWLESSPCWLLAWKRGGFIVCINLFIKVPLKDLKWSHSIELCKWIWNVYLLGLILVLSSDLCLSLWSCPLPSGFPHASWLLYSVNAQNHQSSYLIVRPCLYSQYLAYFNLCVCYYLGLDNSIHM